MTSLVDRVDLVEIALPFRRPFTMAQATIETRNSILVGLKRGGVTGWGEAAPFPNYTGDDVASAWNGLATVAGALVAGTPPSRPILTAAAALGQAWRDLEAREAGQPLYRSLGGSNEPIPASVAIGIPPDLDTLGEVLGEVVAAGYRRVKLKIRPGWDVVPMRFVREVFPGLDVGLDANCSYSGPRDAVFEEMEDCDPSYLEQPLARDDLEGHAELRNRFAFPICLDESIGSLEDAVNALDAEAADIICIKPGRLGTSACVDVHDLATERGVAVKATGLLESGVGRGHTVAVGALPGCTFHDLCASRWYFTGDVITPDWVLTNGMLSPPPGPGIGVDIDPAAVDRFAVRRRSFGA